MYQFIMSLYVFNWSYFSNVTSTYYMEIYIYICVCVFGLVSC